MTEPRNLSRVLIACCLFDPEQRATAYCIENGIREEWFDDQECAGIWSQIFMSFGLGKPMDVFRLTAAWQKIGKQPPAWLDSTTDDVNFALVPAYLHDFRQAWVRRSATTTLKYCPDKLAAAEDAEQAVSAISAELSGLIDSTSDDKPLDVTATELLESWRKRDAERRRREIAWPLMNMQLSLGSLTDEIVYLAAGESVGKTALALQFGAFNAEQGRRVSMRSLESRKDKLVQRLIAQYGKINTRTLRTGNPSPEEHARAASSVPRIKEIAEHLRINDRPANMEQLTAWAHIEKARGAQLLIVDNMKHVRASRRYGSPVEEMRELSAGFKRMRDDVSLPVLILHHTNAEGDVSWSRDIRRDTDILLIMYRDEGRSEPSTQQNDWCGYTVCEFAVEKNREGAAGFKLSAEFDKATQTFREIGER